MDFVKTPGVNNKRVKKKSTRSKIRQQTIHECSQMAGTLPIFVAALAVGILGVLALIQAYFIGQCFRAGQPQENGYMNNVCL